jgi:AcrR family transcriptional regulator
MITRLSLEINSVCFRILCYYLRVVAGLRERKKRATRIAIRDAAMRLFEQNGFAHTTFDRIAEAADVSRATVFSYFPTKEEIVVGDGAAAVGALAATLAERPAGQDTIATVRAWLGELSGWLEPELLLQLRLAREVPAVGARRLQLQREIQNAVADAMEAELGPRGHLPAQLAAASLIAALGIVEETAAKRMAEGGRPLGAAEIDALLDDAVTFAEAGMAAIAP